MDEHEDAYVSDIDIIGELIREELGLVYKNATTDYVPYHVLGVATSIEDVLRYDEDIFSVDLDDTGNIPGLIQDLFTCSGPSQREIAQGGYDEWEGGDAEIVKIDEFYVDRDNNHFRYHWAEFKYLVKHVNRFFDIRVSCEYMLDTFKKFLKQMESLIPIGTLIWRARSNPDQMLSQLNTMQEVCGPPPRNLSKSFRMNPAGISYFYGSVDKSTCKEEICPKIDDKIVYGHFAKKELRIVDLSEAPSIYAKSIFDPEYDHSLNWGSVRKMRIYNAKHIFKTIPQFLTTLRKGQWS
ncbi:hypothetical protein [Solibacillus isronensis]|uniref:hypothetical protein n=1 Tax=Solibacillus isronensis TaxID=412383 RepID=UPI0009A60FA5|nr:hypothetical protein [Solibacillus isronensis]